jgi:superfamily II DNA/RNA helicase
MTQFSDLGLAKPLLAALHAKGYETPTPIQVQSIPALLEGKDLLRHRADRHRKDRRLCAALASTG